MEKKVAYKIAMKMNIVEEILKESGSARWPAFQTAPLDIPGTDVQYYVYAYSNGEREEERGQLCLFFRLQYKEPKEIEAEYTISIESADYSKTRKKVFRRSTSYGGPMVSMEDLFDPAKQFIVDGEMEMKVEGFLMVEIHPPSRHLLLDQSGHRLSVTLWHHDSKDFTIVADGKQIHAHKLILSVRSPVFQAMFQPYTKEARESRVVIPDFSFNVVEAAIKFCYDSSLVENVPFDNQLSLLQFFDKYDIESLKTDLEKHLIGEVDESNVCRLANASIISNAPQLKLKCMKFLRGSLNRRYVCDLDLLDKDFAMDVLKNANYDRV